MKKKLYTYLHKYLLTKEDGQEVIEQMGFKGGEVIGMTDVRRKGLFWIV